MPGNPQRNPVARATPATTACSLMRHRKHVPMKAAPWVARRSAQPNARARTKLAGHALSTAAGSHWTRRPGHHLGVPSVSLVVGECQEQCSSYFTQHFHCDKVTVTSPSTEESKPHDPAFGCVLSPLCNRDRDCITAAFSRWTQLPARVSTCSASKQAGECLGPQSTGAG